MGLGQSKRLSNVHILCVGIYSSVCPFYLSPLCFAGKAHSSSTRVRRQICIAQVVLGAICPRILAPRHECHLWLGIVALGNGDGGGGIESSAYIAPRLPRVVRWRICVALGLGAICLRILVRRHERHLWLGAVAGVDVPEIVGVAGIAVMAIKAKLRVRYGLHSRPLGTIGIHVTITLVAVVCTGMLNRDSIGGKYSTTYRYCPHLSFLNNHSIPPNAPPELCHQPFSPQVFIDPHELALRHSSYFPGTGELESLRGQCTRWMGEGGGTRAT